MCCCSCLLKLFFNLLFRLGVGGRINKCSSKLLNLTALSELTGYWYYAFVAVRIYIILSLNSWVKRKLRCSPPWRKPWPMQKTNSYRVRRNLLTTLQAQKEQKLGRRRMGRCTSWFYQSSKWSTISSKVNISKKRRRLTIYSTKIRSWRSNSSILMWTITRRKSSDCGRRCRNIKLKTRTISTSSSWPKIRRRILKPHRESSRRSSSRCWSNWRRRRSRWWRLDTRCLRRIKTSARFWSNCKTQIKSFPVSTIKSTQNWEKLSPTSK